MIIESLKELFTRDLIILKDEISFYKNETTMWKTTGSIINSGGNICLHLIGNLNMYIGDGLGKISYVRDRDWKFTTKDIPKEKLLARIDKNIKIVLDGLSKVDKKQLQVIFH